MCNPEPLSRMKHYEKQRAQSLGSVCMSHTPNHVTMLSVTFHEEGANLTPSIAPAGVLPFAKRGDDRGNNLVRLQQMFPRIVAADFEQPNHVTPECRHLLKRTLTADPDRRITIPEIMRHPWFQVMLLSSCLVHPGRSVTSPLGIFRLVWCWVCIHSTASRKFISMEQTRGEPGLHSGIAEVRLGRLRYTFKEVLFMVFHIAAVYPGTVPTLGLPQVVGNS